MPKRYLAFDLETARVLPEDVTDVLAHRPLGICCAAAASVDFQEARVWHGRSASGAAAARMTQFEAQALVAELCSFVDSGYTLVTWNGLNFDFNILAEESGLPRECARLASQHVDMMFHAVCQLGHYVRLDKAAQGMGLPPKTKGIKGWQAPGLWAEGKYSEVIKYNAQDSHLTLQLAAACEDARGMRWVTGRGNVKEMPLVRGWLDVVAARQLPLPDTAWMTNPPKREEFVKWFPKE